MTSAAPIISNERPSTPATSSIAQGAVTIIATTLSGYFFFACAWLYWVVAGCGWLVGCVLPRRVIERAPLLWLAGASAIMAAATQTIPNFFPDYTSAHEIGLEILLWMSVGLFARCYIVATDFPATFAGLKQSIEERAIERLISPHLHHPIDAIFTRVWVANTLAVLPLTVLLLLPSTVNYFVVAAYSVALLIGQFPHELVDHINVHTRIFQPKIGSSDRVRRVLRALQFYFEYPHQLMLARAPHYGRIQHVYIHHVEDNGPLDSQTTTPYDRTSFLDFSRHALEQGLDLVAGYKVFPYLAAKGKTRQMRELARGFLIWYGFLAVVAVFNPLAAGVLLVSRFIGGNVFSLISFWQHGLVDPDDVHDVHGNSVDFIGHEHGHMGSDYHVEHHMQPGRHWSAYYEVFTKQTTSAEGHRAVLMQKEVFGPLAFVSALWRRDYDAIAAHANLSGVEASDKATLAAIVAERTRPITGDERSGFSLTVDRTVSRVMAVVLPTRFQI